MSADSPVVSVVLPFYRNPLVKEAAHSILAQSFTDFELIAIDDCSGNGVADLLREIDDPRLRLVVREENGGENATRNHGVSLARGRYIAFQDHDDVSYPERLATQVAFLDANPHVAGCGAACHYGDEKHLHSAPTDVRSLWWEMIFNNHVMFPTVMVRTDIARRYPFGDLVATDDYRWLYEILQEAEFTNIPDVVFHYRMQPTSLSNARAQTQMTHLDTYRGKFALAATGVECGPGEIELLRWLGTPRQECWPSLERLRDASHLLRRLLDGFLERRPGSPEPMRNSALSRLRFAATVSADLGPGSWKAWHDASKDMGAGGFDARLLVKTILRGMMPRRAGVAG